MKIQWKKDVELEMLIIKGKNVKYYDRKFKKGEISEVELTNIPWSEDWQFSFRFLDIKTKDFSSVNLKHFKFIEKKDIAEIKKMLKKYPIEN
jgi:hypothetical protein